MKKVIAAFLMAIFVMCSLVACALDEITENERLVINPENVRNSVIFRELSPAHSGLWVIYQSLDSSDYSHLSQFTYLLTDDEEVAVRSILPDVTNGKSLILCSGNYSYNQFECLTYKTDDGYKAISHKAGMLGWKYVGTEDISEEEATLDKQINEAKEKLSSTVDYLNYGTFEIASGKNSGNYFYLSTSREVEVYNEETLELVNSFTYDTDIVGIKAHGTRLVVAYSKGTGFIIENKPFLN